MSTQSSSSRGMKRARASNIKGENVSSNKEEPPKKIKKRVKSTSSTTPSLPLTKTPKSSSSTQKVLTDSPVKVFKPPPVATLGSLPLHGEVLPASGYNNIPSDSQIMCKQIRDVFSKVKDLRGNSKAKSQIDAQKQRGLVLISYLKKLNRLSHLYCKDSREQTHEQKLEVDDLHLQLQNLMYEAMHLRKEITNCLEFKSQHEEIDLVSEEEMFANAPESISKSEVSQTDEYQKMLGRLQWEMEERKRLAKHKEQLEVDIRKLEAEISTKDGRLTSLLPSLEELRKATLPLQESLGVQLDKDKEDKELALLLPRALYVVFTQSKAYAKVQDPSLSVSIEGDMGEARSFMRSRDKELSDDESGDSESESKEEASRRKKRHKRLKGSQEKKDISKAYPLSVILTFTLKDFGSLAITLNYLPNFNAVCPSVSSLILNNVSDSLLSPLLERSSLLHCLVEGDTGRTSPNSIVSLNIRKHGGDVFSSAVRQYGFPYKWVQRVCGIDDLADLSTQSASSDSVEFQWLNDSQTELSAEHLETIINALRKRVHAQVYLVMQIVALGEDDHKLMLGPRDTFMFRGTPKSQLAMWKSLSNSEVKAFQSSFASMTILNQQERTSRFFLVTYQLGQARMYGLVCVGVDYPTVPPCFAVMVEVDGTKESGSIHTKNIEAEINMRFPQSLEGDKYGQYLLCRQIRRLQECFELYMNQRLSCDKVSRLLCKVRGKGRLLNLSNSA